MKIERSQKWRDKVAESVRRSWATRGPMPKKTAEQRAKNSAAVKRGWAEGRYPRKQSAEFIEKRVAANRGKTQPAGVIERRAAAIKKAHERGAYDKAAATERIKAVTAKRLARGERVGRTPEQLDAMRAMRDPVELRETSSANFAKNLGPLMRDDSFRALHKMARGMPDHVSAKTWAVRDPYGRVYSFGNLSAWVRANIDLFNDEYPESKTPFAVRVAGRIARLFTGDECVQAVGGWTAVSQGDVINGTTGDPLSRTRR